MADYNLHGLNPRDFQHLTQAIARKHIAAGVNAFGDGKDGARDLTFQGKMDYPSMSAGWDGYLILGCKFRQKPTNDPQKDCAWAIKQINADLKKFKDTKRKLRKPDYYLFSTNVSLSAAAETGGRDQVVSVIGSYADALGLKGYGVWDFNDFRSYIDGDESIRAAYGHFITAGDVLAQMAQHIKGSPVDFTNVMHTFLQKELIADMSAKLQSAGDDPEALIPLANVFVDLPFAESSESAVLMDEQRDIRSRKIVQTLLSSGSMIHRKALSDDVRDPGDKAPRHLKASRFVIVGGPGQGKSTFGQYLCQLYRAAILQDRPTERLEVRIPGIIERLKRQQTETDADGLPVARRFPIRIELRNFAQSLEKNQKLTLLEYIRQDIEHLGSATLRKDDLKEWLERYPWLIILDGLDEVPPSSNRADVIKQIGDFLVDAASVDADMLIVATTRPQSYSKEFSEESFSHLYLVPLSPSYSLLYGKKLAEARCGDDSRRCTELVSSLEKACKNPATSRLMQSPLQVTIMATLLEDIGEPPRQRYRLFAEYYSTIYKRETRRKLLGGILTERKKDIDTIHAQAGLLLQAAGEGLGSAEKKRENIDSALSDGQFKTLVSRRLESVGVSPPKVVSLLDRITDESLMRLVFLVRPRDGWVSFDITSLKEFMAAEAIMTGSDEQIRERLKIIAMASYWRNVFQFSAGKCFSEREYLVDSLVSLCLSLNECTSCRGIAGEEIVGRAAEAASWGSQLALDILEDGTARQFPGYEKKFSQIALTLVRVSDPEHCVRLAAIFHEDLHELYVREINDRLGQKDWWFRTGAWYLLAGLISRGEKWAKKIAEGAWGHEEIQCKESILFHAASRFRSDWVIEKLNELALVLNPIWYVHYLNTMESLDVSKQLPLKELLQNRMHNNYVSIPNNSNFCSIISSFHVVPCELNIELIREVDRLEFKHPGWQPLGSAIRFSKDPSAKTLATELRTLALSWKRFSGFNSLPMIFPIPWPLFECLAKAKNADEAIELAIAAEQGYLGDRADWLAAEGRWREHGVINSDFKRPFTLGVSLSPEISAVGFPFVAGGAYAGGYDTSVDISVVLTQLNDVTNVQLRSVLAQAVWPFATYGRGLKKDSEPRQLREFFGLALSNRDIASRESCDLSNVISHIPTSTIGEEWVDLFQWMGENRVHVYARNISIRIVNELVSYFSADPKRRRGLLSVIADFAVEGRRVTIPEHILLEAMHWGSDERIDAITLRVCSDAVEEIDVKNIAREIIQCPSVLRAVARTLESAAAFSYKRSAQLALELMAVLNVRIRDEATAFDRAREKINNYLVTMPSLLQDQAIWRRLQLPDQL